MGRRSRAERLEVVVDCVLLGVDQALRVVVVPDPGAGLRLPEVVLGVGEGLAEAARRALTEQVGAPGVYLEQLYTFGQPGRAAGKRQLSVAFLGLADLSDGRLEASVAALDGSLPDAVGLTGLALDHDDILAAAVARLRGKLRYTPLAFELLPEHFSLSGLQRVFEAVLGAPQDKRNFRRKALASGLLVDTGQRQQGVAHRAARLFRFDRRAYARTLWAGKAMML